MKWAVSTVGIFSSKMGQTPRLLISGFEAFGGGSSNPSSMICEALERQHRAEALGGFALRAVILPVTFGESFTVLKREIETFGPHVVLCLGQAGGRRHIELERIAINLIDSEMPDNAGFTVREQPIVPGAALAYLSRLPLRRLEAALKNRDIPVGISNSAGLYVCNFVFYKLMDLIGEKASGGFVHLPYLPDQAHDAENRRSGQSGSTGGGDTETTRIPSMEFALMLEGVKLLVQTLMATPPATLVPTKA